MENPRDELADAIAELQERISEDLHPVLETLAEDAEGSRVEEVWNRLIEEALNEA